MPPLHVSRRDFLKAALAGATLLATRAQGIHAQANINESILILGAGVAGLSAATVHGAYLSGMRAAQALIEGA